MPRDIYAKVERAVSGHVEHKPFVFPTKVFHRSGSAPRRCVKVALFFKVKNEVKGEDEGGKVKSEVKSEASSSQTTS